jgi:uncharacterized protein YbjT (DUF2867 family)
MKIVVVETIADAATHGNTVRVSPVLIQPIAADDVARAVAKIATGTPLNGTVEIGGPEPSRRTHPTGPRRATIRVR